ncbi:MAG: MFS transporter [Proteobacteria bacterium]|nr:MFS transporter [Pseudomonadota bacterium]
MRLTDRTAIVVALGTAQTLSWGSVYYLPAILAAPIARDLGLPVSWFFGVFSGALLLTAFLGPSVGRRIDRYGGRGVLAGTNVIFAAGLVTLGCTQGLTGVILAWVLLGIGMGAGLYDAAFATLTTLYGRDARGPITGITLIAGLASTICWPISAVLDAEFGWRTACFVWAAAQLVIGLPLNLLLGPPTARAAPAATSGSEDVPAHRRAMILLAFVFATAWFVTGSMAAHLPRLLEAAGTSATAAIAASALVGPAQVAARLAEFGFLRRAHPLISARIAASTHPIGALVFILAGAGPIAAAAFALLYGAGNGLLTIARGTLPLAIFGPIGYGLRSGLIGAPARATQAFAPFLFSLVLDGAGPTVALLLSSSMTLAALGGLLMLRTTARDAPMANPSRLGEG